QPVQGFEAPARWQELGRQIVEELGMGWRASREAKVVRGGNYPRPKMMLPDAVDRDAGEERILLRCDPAGQGPAAPRARLARTRRFRGVDIARCAAEARRARD